jgi:hypothetical protein
MDILGVAANSLISAGREVQFRAENLVNHASGNYFQPASLYSPLYSPLVTGGSAALFTQNVEQPSGLFGDAIGLLTASRHYEIAASLVKSADDVNKTLIRSFGYA